MVERFVTEEGDSALLQKVVFDRLYWDKLDEGTISDEEALGLMKERLPKRLHGEAEKIYYNWIYNIPEIEGMTDLIREMKSLYGIHAFALSNISTYFVSHREELSFLGEFQKCIFSSVYGVTKPDPKIYRILCKECCILPEETIFIDDRQINVEAARDYGLRGYQFDGNVPALRKYLTELLSSEN